MKKYISIFLIACGLFSSCSNDNEDFFKGDTPDIAPGVYSSDLVLQSETGQSTENITRGVDDLGNFTNEYPFEVIYVHSADNGESGDHKVLEVPLKDVVFCNGCRGMHLEMEVKEDGEGYTIRNSDGESITLTDDESVYFSSYPYAYWHAEPIDGTPVGDSPVFQQTEGVNEELLKSEIYSKEDLVNLLQQGAPQIPLTRHCTGFRTTFMFTDVTSQGGHSFSIATEEQWATFLHGTKPSDFYIKLYLGPNFCEDYDILNNSVPETDRGGYYVTNNNEYISLKQVVYVTSGATSEPSEVYSYWGFGYGTETGNILMAPLNLNEGVGNIQDFSIYVFIKYMPEGSEINTTSDNNSVWLRVPIPDMTDLANRMHNLIVALDVHELEEVMQKTSTTTLTRGIWNKPIELELNHPIKIINIQQ